MHDVEIARRDGGAVKHGSDPSNDELYPVGDKGVDQRFLVSLRLGHEGTGRSCARSGHTL